MKKLFFVLAICCLAHPAWADDELKPEPLGQAIQEYAGIWQASDIDPMNHEVWKLYVYFQLTPSGGYNTQTPQWLVCGLTPDPRKGFSVIVGINQLYNFLRPAPQRGDVIVVEGRIQSKINASDIKSPTHIFTLKGLDMYVENAVALPNEHVDFNKLLAATPTNSTPSVGTPQAPAAAPSPMGTPMNGTTPSVSTQGAAGK